MVYDSVFVSDVHLGTDRCNVKKFKNFIKNLKTKKLVFVGDIIDIECMEKYGTQWNRSHTECVHEILKLANQGTEIVYILGNHDAALRRYCNFEHKNFMMCDEYVYKTKLGEKYLCIHGDKYSQFSSGSWKQLCFNWGYELITPLSVWLNRYFKFSLVNFLKNTVNGKKYIEQYESDISSYASKSGNYSGVICGHIHHANMRDFDGIKYMCCGDFVDTCSAIYEKDGKFSMHKF